MHSKLLFFSRFCMRIRESQFLGENRIHNAGTAFHNSKYLLHISCRKYGWQACGSERLPRNCDCTHMSNGADSSNVPNTINCDRERAYRNGCVGTWNEHKSVHINWKLNWGMRRPRNLFKFILKSNFRLLIRYLRCKSVNIVSSDGWHGLWFGDMLCDQHAAQ